MTTKLYPFCIYTEIQVEIFTKKTNKKTLRFSTITFYKKKYYCAHVVVSDFQTIYNDFVQLGKDSEIDINKYIGTLHPGEWIEDTNNSKIVCLVPSTCNLVTIRSGNDPLFDIRIGREVEDAYGYLDKKGYTFTAFSQKAVPFLVR